MDYQEKYKNALMLYYEGIRKMESKEYNDSIDCFYNCIAITLQTTIVEMLEKEMLIYLADCYTRIGGIYVICGKYMDAAVNFKLGLDMCYDGDLNKTPVFGTLQFRIAELNMITQRYDRAIEYYDLAIKNFLPEKHKMIKEIVESYDNIYKCCVSLNDYNRALDYTIKAQEEVLRVYENDSYEEGYYSEKLANIYEALENYEKAVIYYKQAISYFMDVDDSNNKLIMLYTNVASIYLNKLNNIKAASNLFNEMRLKTNDALLDDVKKFDTYAYIWSHVLLNEGESDVHKNEALRLVEANKSSLEHNVNSDPELDDYHIIDAYIMMAKYWLLEEEYYKAIEKLKDAERYCQVYHRGDSKILKWVYYMFAACYYYLGEFETVILYGNKVLELHNEDDWDDIRLGELYVFLSVSYENLEQRDYAVHYYHRARVIQELKK